VIRPPAEPVDEAWILHLARETMAEAIGPNKGYQYLSGERDEYDCMKGCVAAIRRTLAHRGARWPRGMPCHSTMKAWAKEIGEVTRDTELAAARMADRIVAHMTGETE
jgi:hypothetical protein